MASRRLRRRVWAQKQAAAKSQGPDLSRALREVQEKVTKLEQELEDGKGDRLGRKQAEAALRRQADHSQTLQAQLDAMQAELMQAPPRPDRVRSPLLELRPLLHKLRIRRCRAPLPPELWQARAAQAEAERAGGEASALKEALERARAREEEQPVERALTRA